MTLPPDLIALDSPAGQKLLIESKANAAFFPLIENYVSQQSQSFCGIASSVIVLNALHASGPADGYTQDNLWNGDAQRLGVAHGGLTLDELRTMLATLPVDAKEVYASDTTLEQFRAQATVALGEPGTFLIINYLRSAVHQEPSGPIVGRIAGHFSPLAAYSADGDRFLLLDVNRGHYPPAWIPAALLWDAMRAVDFDSGRSRGYVVVRAASQSSPPADFHTPRNRLPLIALGLLLFVFLLGAASASLIGWLRRRRP